MKIGFVKGKEAQACEWATVGSLCCDPPQSFMLACRFSNILWNIDWIAASKLGHDVSSVPPNFGKTAKRCKVITFQQR